MSKLARQIIKEGSVILHLSTEQIGIGCYEKTQSGSVSQLKEEDRWVYLVSYRGSPFSSENETIESCFSYATAEEAAIALINKYKIIGIRHGCAIFAPSLKPVKQVLNTCYRCEFFCPIDNFCAVNPSYLGVDGCPDRNDLPLEKPKIKPQQLARKFSLAKSLLQVGVALE